MHRVFLSIGRERTNVLLIVTLCSQSRMVARYSSRHSASTLRCRGFRKDRVKTGLGVISRELQFEAHFFAATFGVLRLSMAGMRAREEKMISSGGVRLQHMGSRLGQPKTF